MIFNIEGKANNDWYKNNIKYIANRFILIVSVVLGLISGIQLLNW